MFYYLHGAVASLAPYLAVIDCGGVGYACRTTSQTLSRLRVGEKAKLYYPVIRREDAAARAAVFRMLDTIPSEKSTWVI